jgi:hypothetical protein
MTPFHILGSSGKADINADDHNRLRDTPATSTSFLSDGRGGERVAPPLPMLNGIANGEIEESPPPPPLPVKSTRRGSGSRLKGIAEEEMMLMNELDLLEKLVDSKDVRRAEEEEEEEEEEPPEIRGLERAGSSSVSPEQDSKA